MLRRRFLSLLGLSALAPLVAFLRVARPAISENDLRTRPLCMGEIRGKRHGKPTIDCHHFLANGDSYLVDYSPDCNCLKCENVDPAKWANEMDRRNARYVEKHWRQWKASGMSDERIAGIRAAHPHVA